MIQRLMITFGLLVSCFSLAAEEAAFAGRESSRGDGLYDGTGRLKHPPNARYLVVGSFRNQALADDRRAFIESLPNQPGGPKSVLVLDFQAAGSTHHRVILGPVLAEDISALKAWLAQEGIPGAWTLRHLRIALPSDQSSSLVVPPVMPSTVAPPVMPSTVAPPVMPSTVAPSGMANDYSLARLKKKHRMMISP